MLDVLGLGLCTIDILIRLEQMPTWEQGTPLDALRLDGGGPVGTALVAASRLGLRCGYLGTCGSDSLGQLKRQLLEVEGIDTSRLIIRPGPEKQVILVFIQASTWMHHPIGLWRSFPHPRFSGRGGRHHWGWRCFPWSLPGWLDPPLAPRENSCFCQRSCSHEMHPARRSGRHPRLPGCGRIPAPMRI